MSSSGQLPERIRQVHLERFLELDAAQPGQWALLPIHPDVAYWSTSQSPVDVAAIRLELQDVLPFPAPDANFADILEFRARRHPELLALRTYLDGLYDDICRSRDVQASWTHALDQLDTALRNVDRASREFNFNWVRSAFRVDVIIDAVGYGTAAQDIAAWLGASAPHSVEIGTAAGIVRAVRKVLKSPVSRAGPLEYLYHAHQEQLVRPTSDSAVPVRPAN